MIPALTTLFVFQLIGEILTRMTGMPIPGPVVGMILLFGFLLSRKSIPPALQTTSQTLLSHLSLLFVPAGVGIMKHYALIRQEWIQVTITLLLSTIITIAVTAFVTCFLLRRTGKATHS